MPRSLLMHDAVWVRQLAAELRLRGHPVEQLLAEAQLSDSVLNAERARIPFVKHAAFFEIAANATGNGCLGLKFGQTRDTRDSGLIGYLGLSSSSLLEAIRSLSRYRRVFSDAAEVGIDELESRGFMHWRFEGTAPQISRQCTEFAASNIVRAFRNITGKHIVPEHLHFAHNRNEDIELFEDFFGSIVSFGEEANVIALNPADLSLPLVKADDRLEVILRRYCEELLSAPGKQLPSLVAEVENLVAARLTQGPIGIDRIARELGTSSRSLARRLSESHTSFGRIVQDVRKKLAFKYLQEGELSVTEVAFLLGYSEVSTFNHSFRRWTGISPSQYRKEL